MQETCLICQGNGGASSAREPCPYCGGTGRVKIHTEIPQTVLLATGSCKVPMRKVVLDGGLKLERKYVPSP
jgi:DnaJ-class molecular chaperone